MCPARWRVVTGGSDRWHRWLPDVRHGGDTTCRDHLLAAAKSVLGRSTFVQTAADSRAGIPDGSVDVVTTRSVLIYVKDKAAAFRAFYRVLKPGGRVSLFEPVNRLHTAPRPFRRLRHPADRSGGSEGTSLLRRLAATR